jgi:hypothetical protein
MRELLETLVEIDATVKRAGFAESDLLARRKVSDKEDTSVRAQP